jgi:hypothetical protein
MPLALTHHARVRMRERRVQDAEVALVVSAPDEIDYGEDGEVLARKRVGRRTLEVVYDEVGDTKRVITVLVL